LSGWHCLLPLLHSITSESLPARAADEIEAHIMANRKIIKFDE
jgi:hypothetical protein